MKKKEFFIYIFLIIFFIISITTIYSSNKININKNLYIKQIIWYIIGISIMLLIKKIGKSYLYKISFFFYIIFNILLLGLLFFGKYINGARCWYNIFGIGFQPSEFMKIILIVIDSIIVNNKKSDSKLILQLFIITLIPSILTFLEPDTGNVIIYFIIMFSYIFISKINYKWYLYIITFFILIFGLFFILYYKYNNIFINIFGTSFSLRLNRILSWKNSSGYQFLNGISCIGSSYIFGNGFNNIPLYFPESTTDYIFAVFASNYGFIGSIILIIILLSFDIKLVNLAYKKHGNTKYVILGLVSMLVYQQFQNIGMTLGIVPITGITLPFISYGGSSLISYFILLGFCI